MELSTDNYITIVTTLLTLVFGGGLGKSVLDRRAERRKAEEEAKRAEAEKRELYRQGFLENLQFTLNLNKHIHTLSTKDLDLRGLEYAPDYIQQEWNKLDDSDSIQQYRINQVQTLISNNEHAIRAIRDNLPKVENDRLKRSLEEFATQAQDFDNIWRKITSATDIEPGRNPNTALLSDEYPKELDRLLQEEIDRCKSKNDVKP